MGAIISKGGHTPGIL